MWFRNKRDPDWHETFVSIARRVFDGRDLAFEQALTALRNANGQQLLAFDEEVRRRGEYWNAARGYPKAIVKTALSNPDHADAYLFYEACSGSGFVREQALRALRGHDQRLACAAILIRSQDWVPQVASVAALLLKDIAASDTVRHCFELLDLIVALRSRQRFEPQWVGILEPALMLPQWREARHAQLRSRNDGVRYLAHQLIWRADEDSALATPRLAIGDPSRLVALWALTKISESADESLRRTLLQEGLRTRLAAVRSEALRRYCRGGFGDLREVLEVAIFDPANSVRGVAVNSGRLLAAALQDSSSRVVGAAIAGYVRGIEPMTVEALNEALAVASTSGMRARLISASRLLWKWNRLQFLLAHIATSDDADRAPLDAAMWRWIASANSSFIAVRPEQQLDLRRAIETARAVHPARYWDRILALV